MASKPDDADVIEQPNADDQGGPQANDELQPGEDGEVEVSFGEEAPAGGEDGQESSVIRGLRQQLREASRRAAAAEKVAPPPAIVDPGAEPVYEGNEDAYSWDTVQFMAEWREWNGKQAAYSQAVARAQQAEHQRIEAYNSQKATLKLPGIDEAEKRVFAEVDEITKNALIRAKSPALVFALDRNPEKLAAIVSQSDPVEMLMMLGELRGKTTVTQRRKAPNPEEIASGTGAMPGGTDKTLEKLQKAADASGDRTELVAYKASLKAKAAAK